MSGKSIDIEAASPDEAATSQSNQLSWGAILLIYAIGVLGATSISQAIPIVGDIARSYHLGPSQSGWIISMPSAVVALGAIFTGWLVDRLGDKLILLLGCAIVAIGDIGVTLAQSAGVLYAMRIVEGIGYVGISVAAVAMITRATEGKRRTSALTLWSSFVPMSFIAPLLLAAQVAGSDRWPRAFWGHGIVLAFLALVALALLPAHERGRGKATRTSGIHAVLRSRAPYLLGLAFACGAFLQTGVASTLPHILPHRFAVSAGFAASVVTIGMILNLAGCLAVGPLLNRGASAFGVALLGVALTAAGGVALYVPGLGVTLVFAAACVFFLGSGVVVGLWALLPKVAPNPAAIGATSGLVTQLVLWGVLFGPPGAFALLSSDWMQQSAVVLLACFLCLGLLWLVTRDSIAAPSASSSRRHGEKGRGLANAMVAVRGCGSDSYSR